MPSLQMNTSSQAAAHTAYLSLGSNFANAAQMLSMARERIAELPQCAIGRASTVYLTEPQGYAAQPWFHNQVIQLKLGPNWQPHTLMRALLNIETKLGRRRGPIRFGPRAIDIDILLFDDLCQDDPVCILPHPRLHERAFALAPLLDTAPEIEIGGKPARELLNALIWRLDGNKIFQ